MMRRSPLLFVAIVATLVSTVGQAGLPANLIVNPGFERGGRGWKPSWNDGQVDVVSDAERSRTGRSHVVIAAEHENVGIDSVPLRVGADINPGKSYVVSAWIANLGIDQGQFGMRLYAYDAMGNTLAMRSVGSLGPESVPADWKQILAHIGSGTDFPFPEEMDHLVVRFSIWDKTDVCAGRVLVDDIVFAPMNDEPAGTVREFERTDKGSIAIWSDLIPGIVAATDPNRLATQLRQAGYGVTLIATSELADAAVLSEAHFDLLILPYAEIYPATGAETLRRFFDPEPI